MRLRGNAAMRFLRMALHPLDRSIRSVSPFLEPDDVRRLTGYEMASFQLKFCRNNGIPAWLNAKGEVIIARAAIEGRKTAANEPAWRPDFSALRSGE